eukprot:Opistho-2@15198
MALNPQGHNRAANSSSAGTDGRQLFMQSYDLGNQLGQGAFAVVKKCTNKITGKDCAVKIINRTTEKNDLQLLQEIRLLTRMKHKHIVELFETFESPKHMYIVMELVSGGEMFDRIVDKGYFEEADAAKAMGQICDALAFLHKHNIMHRDIKPENILYAHPGPDADLKLADFGLAKVLEKDLSYNTMCGTPGYIAPEIILSKPYGTPVDMFAVGVILFITLSGTEPFYEESDAAVFQRIAACDYSLSDHAWDPISAGAKDLVKRLLVLDGKERLTAEQTLKHPWIRELAPESVKLTTTYENLKKWNAKRKWKAGVKAVQALGRLRNHEV